MNKEKHGTRKKINSQHALTEDDEACQRIMIHFLQKLNYEVDITDEGKKAVKMAWFLIGRFFQGVVVSTILIAGYTMIYELMKGELAVKTISWMGSITILAPALGPPWGGCYYNG